MDALCAAVASGADTDSYNRKEVEQVRDALARWALPAGGAGMVGVAVREQDRGRPGPAAEQAGRRVSYLGRVLRPAGVHEAPALARADEVHVDGL